VEQDHRAVTAALVQTQHLIFAVVVVVVLRQAVVPVYPLLVAWEGVERRVALAVAQSPMLVAVVAGAMMVVRPDQAAREAAVRQLQTLPETVRQAPQISVVAVAGQAGLLLVWVDRAGLAAPVSSLLASYHRKGI